MKDRRLPASFRDPAGFMYRDDGTLYRHVDPSYAAHYDLLMRSGLYEQLAGNGWLIAHQEVDRPGSNAYRTLLPRIVPYVSYPHEWCFGQWKDAALLTLDIQIASLSFGMVLKDASAYNIQFIGSRPVFIDTLSFETYEEGRPWIAYRQFCEHFLGPLALMAHCDARLRGLLVHYSNGLPLDLVANLLPLRTRARFGLLAHIHLHARTQAQHRADGGASQAPRIPRLPKSRLLSLMESLRAAVLGCRLPKRRSEWSDYYDETNYSTTSMSAKEALVTEFIDATAEPRALIHDLGANTGRFSRLVAGPDRYVVAHDVDDLAVEANYSEGKRLRSGVVLPLVLDLVNPSPAIGWALEERSSALERIAGGNVLALALIHHLAISNNVPLSALAAFFARIAKTLVIEFVPKEDSQVRRLLATREDIFSEYTIEAFEAVFTRFFEITHRQAVPGTVRTLFAMRRRAGAPA